jgi:hypothetical protein
VPVDSQKFDTRPRMLSLKEKYVEESGSPADHMSRSYSRLSILYRGSIQVGFTFSRPCITTVYCTEILMQVDHKLIYFPVYPHLNSSAAQISVLGRLA